MAHSIDSAAPALPPLRPGPWQRRMDVIVVVATFGGLLFGYDTGVLNGALEPMKFEFGLSAATEGLVVSILLIGAALGALAAGRLADRFGRRRTLVYLAVVFFLGTLGSVIAPSLAVMLPSRFVLGLAVGGASVVVPIYLSELAPTERRGALGGRNELAIVAGQLAAFAVNAIIAAIWPPATAENPAGHEGVWRLMLAICAIPAVCLFVGMLKMPESPRWYIRQGRYDDALAVLDQVRGPERARAELAELADLARSEEKQRTASWGDLGIGWVRRLLLAAIILAVGQQATGVNSVMIYGTQMLQTAGFSGAAAPIANVFVGSAAVVGSIFCLFYLIDRVPRRTLLLTGMTLVMCCHAAIVAVTLLLPDGSTAQTYAILVLLALFILVQQTTMNVTTWVCLSELFPLWLRGFGMGAAALVLWLANAAVGQAVPWLVQEGGLTGTYGTFLVTTAIFGFLMYKTLPNTSGRSLEQLEKSFAAGDFR
ncbi:MAG: sugar porter family MFS transporter [Gordonia sp. (in: high G+C Gram-positive bacteria)]